LKEKATRESREGRGERAARKILRRGREVTKHGAVYKDIITMKALLL